MGDMRFVLIGVALIFAGFVVLEVLGQDYQAAVYESAEFGTCYEYSDTAPPRQINCSYRIFDQTVSFGIVLALIAGGVISLIKGVKGNWDSSVRPEDMAGPGGSQSDSSKNQKGAED